MDILVTMAFPVNKIPGLKGPGKLDFGITLSNPLCVEPWRREALAPGWGQGRHGGGCCTDGEGRRPLVVEENKVSVLAQSE